MIRFIHLNTEFIAGFIEAGLCEFEISIGPFMKDLDAYEIKVEGGIEPHTIEAKIYFHIKTDNKDGRFASIYINQETTLEAFRLKVETAVEQIITTIKEFDSEH